MMGQGFIDTYMIVLLLVEFICGKHIILKRKKVFQELHNVIKTLYQEKIVHHLHSCLEEIISVAISRLDALKILELSSYGNKQGKETRFLLSHEEMRPELHKQLSLITKLRNLSVEEMQRIDDEI
jgi:hypothetical protein